MPQQPTGDPDAPEGLEQWIAAYYFKLEYVTVELRNNPEKCDIEKLNMARRTLRAGTRARGTRELDARGLQTPTRSGLSSSCAGTGGGFGGGTGGGGSGGGELYS